MNETRLEKYKNYRESLNEVKANNKKDDTIEFRKTRLVTDKINTTSTLPLEEVLGKIEEDNEEIATQIITKKRIMIASFIVVGILLTIGITIFAIFAFGGLSK